MKFVTSAQYCDEWGCTKSVLTYMIRKNMIKNVKGHLVDIDTPPISIAKTYTSAQHYDPESKLSKLPREERIKVLASRLDELKQQRRELEQRTDVQETVMMSVNKEIEATAKRLVSEQMDI